MRVLAILFFAVLIACGGDDDGGGPGPRDAGPLPDTGPLPDAGPRDSGPPDAGPCGQIWHVNMASAGASATVSDGSLVINAPSTPAGNAIDVYQSGLTGDFEAAFVVGGFSGPATPLYGQAYVSVESGEPRVGTGGWTMSAGTIRAIITNPDTMPVTDMRATTATSGEVRFRRAGDLLTVTTIAGSDVAQVMETVPGTLRIGVQIGNSSSMVLGDTGLRIDAFTITGGGGTVLADTFDCNSLGP